MNLFEIEQELLEVVSELEENGGELTPELEEKLSIADGNFRYKIEQYCNVIKQLQFEQDAIKVEQKRLKDLSDRKAKTVERLKDIIIPAIEQFGDTKKSGVRYVGYNTGEVSVRKSTAIQLDEEHIDTINLHVQNIIDYLKSCEDTPITANRIKALFGKEPTADSEYIDTEFVVKMPLSNVIDDNKADILAKIFEESILEKTNINVSKTTLKAAFEKDGTSSSSLGKIVVNKNISIK